MGAGQVAKLESGQRTITLDDALLFAAALDVAPPALYATEPLRITHNLVVDPYDAWLWHRGYKPLPNQDEWHYYGELPDADKKKIDLKALVKARLTEEEREREEADNAS